MDAPTDFDRSQNSPPLNKAGCSTTHSGTTRVLLNGLAVVGEVKHNGDQIPGVLTAEQGFKASAGGFRRDVVRWLVRQSDGVPWLKSQNVCCQLEIHPSVPQATQRQTMTSFSVMPVSTTRWSRSRYLKQTGPGTSSDRSKSDACATTATRKDAIFRAGPRSGAIEPLESR